MHSVAIDQLTDEYKAKGYQVSKEEPIGNYRADLVARKGDETIVVEIKAGKLTPERKAEVSKIADYIRDKHNYKFLVVFATPPKDKKLEVSNIDELLYGYISNHLPDDLNELSTHSVPEMVDDVNIDEVTVNQDGSILVKGNGVISLELQFGSDSDQNNGLGLTMHDSFPFDFEVTLELDDKKNFTISREVDPKIEVDTSGYYH